MVIWIPDNFVRYSDANWIPDTQVSVIRMVPFENWKLYTNSQFLRCVWILGILICTILQKLKTKCRFDNNSKF